MSLKIPKDMKRDVIYETSRDAEVQRIFTETMKMFSFKS